MKTEIVLTDNNLEVGWTGSYLIVGDIQEAITLTYTETITLRDFLNQLPLTNPLTKEK